MALYKNWDAYLLISIISSATLLVLHCFTLGVDFDSLIDSDMSHNFIS